MVHFSGVRHFDGNAWLDLPGAPAGNNVIVAIDPSDAWVAGPSNELRHYDGATWVPHDVSEWMSLGVRGLAATAPDDVWALSHGGVLLHWDGYAWSPVSYDAPNDGIQANPSGAVTLAEHYGRLLHIDASGVMTWYDDVPGDPWVAVERDGSPVAGTLSGGVLGVE